MLIISSNLDYILQPTKRKITEYQDFYTRFFKIAITVSGMPSNNLSCARNVPITAVSSGIMVTVSFCGVPSQTSDGGLISTTPPHLHNEWTMN